MSQELREAIMRGVKHCVDLRQIWAGNHSFNQIELILKAMLPPEQEDYCGCGQPKVNGKCSLDMKDTIDRAYEQEQYPLNHADCQCKKCKEPKDDPIYECYKIPKPIINESKLYHKANIMWSAIVNDLKQSEKREEVKNIVAELQFGSMASHEAITKIMVLIRSSTDS